MSGRRKNNEERDIVPQIDGIEDRANYWIQVDPATVEQFTGLTDKHSKKIILYERSMLL